MPAHSFDRVEKLSEGEIAEIEIDLLPTGLAFFPGEQPRFAVSSANLLGVMTPTNRGRRRIHTRGDHAPYPHLPIHRRCIRSVQRVRIRPQRAGRTTERPHRTLSETGILEPSRTANLNPQRCLIISQCPTPEQFGRDAN